MSHNHIVKSSEKINNRNVFKTCLQAAYPTDFF